VWFRKRKPHPAEVARELREQIFTLRADELGLSAGPGHEHVWGVLMETGYPEAVASLVTIADGTTSLYFSNGGGILGAGDHTPVREATTEFIAAVDAQVGAFRAASEHPLPAVGRVRFYVRTFSGLLTAEADEQDLGENRHALSPIFHIGHAVIAAVREASPQS
jgi:hypothetical protein